MCIILMMNKQQYDSNKDTIKGYFECSEYSNPHGTGLAFIQGGKVDIMKGIGLDVASLIESRDWEHIVVHYRYATQGRLDDTNCHPFYTGHGWLFHNGVYNDDDFAIVGGYNVKEMSDTHIVARFFNDFNIPLERQVEWLNAQLSKYVLVADNCKVYHNLPYEDEKTGILTSNDSYKIKPIRAYSLNNKYNYAYNSYGLWGNYENYKDYPGMEVHDDLGDIDYIVKMYFGDIANIKDFKPCITDGAIECMKMLSSHEVDEFLSLYSEVFINLNPKIETVYNRLVDNYGITTYVALHGGASCTKIIQAIDDRGILILVDYKGKCIRVNNKYYRARR